MLKTWRGSLSEMHVKTDYKSVTICFYQILTTKNPNSSILTYLHSLSKSRVLAETTNRVLSIQWALATPVCSQIVVMALEMPPKLSWSLETLLLQQHKPKAENKLRPNMTKRGLESLQSPRPVIIMAMLNLLSYKAGFNPGLIFTIKLLDRVLHKKKKKN